MNDEEIIHGVINGDPQLTDFSYEGINSVNPETLPDVKNGIMLPFNQWLKTLTTSACTINNAARNLLYVASVCYGYQPKEQDIIDAVNYATTQWYIPGQGWYVTKGVDVVRKRWNINHPNQQMTSYTVAWDNIDFPTLLLKGYPMTGSYQWGTSYNSDYRKDAILDGSSFPDVSYGHCTIRQKQDKLVVNDSYTWTKYNIYEIKNPGWVIQSGCWNKNFYFFAPFNPQSAEIKRLTAIIANCTTQNSCVDTLKSLSSDKNFQNEQDILFHVNQKKIQQSQEMLSKL